MNNKFCLLALIACFASLQGCLSDETTITTTDPGDSLADTTSRDSSQFEWPSGKLGLMAYHMNNSYLSFYDTILRFPTVDSLQRWDTTQWWSAAVLPADCKPIVIRMYEGSGNMVYFPDSLMNDTLLMRTYLPGNGSESWETGGCALDMIVRTHEQLYCWNDSLPEPTRVRHTGWTYRPDWHCGTPSWSNYDATTGEFEPYVWVAP